MLAGTHLRVPANKKERVPFRTPSSSYSCTPFEFVVDGTLCPWVGVPWIVPLTCPEESMRNAIWSCTWAALLEPPFTTSANMRQPESLVRRSVTCPW